MITKRINVLSVKKFNAIILKGLKIINKAIASQR
jgi:hypothetical protein